jgi:hypothetical protein
MKNIIWFVAALAALPAAASAASTPLGTSQEGPRMWTDLAESRSFALQEGREGRGRGGQVVEEWYTPRMRGSLAVYGRVSFPSSTEVTTDGLWYSDFFDPGLGVSIEGDLLSYITPHWGVGGYVSVNWDRFDGESVGFPNGDFLEPDHMDLTSVIVGAKVIQRVSPFFVWDGHLGIGLVHYSSTKWSGFDSAPTPPTPPGPFSGEELFRSTNTVVGEIGGRVGFGGPHLEVDLGFGIRIMGGPERGRDVTTFVDPDILTTFMIELGVTGRF